MSKNVAQMIEKQVQLWTLKNSTERKKGKSFPKNPIITVSREFGAQGAALAEKLGSKLGFKVWDKELLSIISEKLESNQELIKSLDERHQNLLEDTIFGVMRHKGTNLNYLLQLVRAVRSIEDFGNSIIVGRGANYICQHPGSFHIRVVSPLKTRVERYAKREGLQRDAAYAVVVQKDAERSSFIKYNFNREVYTSSDYDLVLNSGVFTLDELTDMAVKAYRTKKARTKKGKQDPLAV